MDLIYFDRARAALARSIDLNELKAIRDKAEALRNYAGLASDMARRCQELRLRAERRIGELLAKAVRPGNPQLSRRSTIGLGKLGITRDQSSRWQTAATLPAEKFERYLRASREPTTAGVLRLVHEQRRNEAAASGPRSGGNILSAPASTLWQRLDDDSVDLFLTDPPYAEIERYRELAELAATKLKPGGLCLAYAGIGYLPQVLEAMSALTYYWTFAIEVTGHCSMLYYPKVKNAWQPVIACSKGKSRAGYLTDHLYGGGREKDNHDHEKTLTNAAYLIDKLTQPGDLVVDPYCGSGTIPAACKRLGRNWLACEIDSGTARVARRRVAA
jgi:site-specific DNA-methyltransferase (adenine-specific)